MNQNYTDKINRIIKGFHAQDGGGFGSDIMLLDFSNPAHYDCLMAQYGGEAHVKETYPLFYKTIQDTKNAHLQTAPPKALTQEPGLNDFIYIYELFFKEGTAQGFGAATLTEKVYRLFITLSLYDGDTCIASESDFFHGVSREVLSCKVENIRLSGRYIRAVLHVTWQNQSSNVLRSAIAEMRQAIESVDPINNVIIEHPRLNPGYVPEPIEESEGYQGEAAAPAPESRDGAALAAAQEFINICYARCPLGGERCDYLYPFGLEDGLQNIYLDVRGEVFLDKPFQYKGRTYADLGLDTPFGCVLHTSKLPERFFKLTSTGFTFGFPTDWKTPIPGGIMAGQEMCYLIGSIMFQCMGEDTDYTIKLNSRRTGIGQIRHNVEIPSIKLNWGCVADDTQITMADKTVKLIGDIHPGDRVSAGPGNGSTEVYDVIKGTEAAIWTVQTFGCQPIRVTGNHPFVTRKGIKMAEELMETDELLREDGSYALMEYRYEVYYGKTVYNLLLGGPHSMVGNGYVIGDNEQQGNSMREAIERNEKVVPDSIIEECRQMKEEFSR